ncbi:unnamed protein product [Lampetra planeri]
MRRQRKWPHARNRRLSLARRGQGWSHGRSGAGSLRGSRGHGGVTGATDSRRRCGRSKTTRSAAPGVGPIGGTAKHLLELYGHVTESLNLHECLPNAWDIFVRRIQPWVALYSHEVRECGMRGAEEGGSKGPAATSTEHRRRRPMTTVATMAVATVHLYSEVMCSSSGARHAFPRQIRSRRGGAAAGSSGGFQSQGSSGEKTRPGGPKRRNDDAPCPASARARAKERRPLRTTNVALNDEVPVGARAAPVTVPSGAAPSHVTRYTIQN